MDGNVFRLFFVFVCKLFIINELLVEAAGVEPVISTENTQVTETENARKALNSTIASFAYKSRTKNFRNSQNCGRCIFRPVLADGLKYSLFFIHQTDPEMAASRGPHFCLPASRFTRTFLTDSAFRPREITDQFGNLDVLFVNAGIADLKPIEKWDE